MSARSELPSKDRKKATSTSPWETILIASNSNEANRDCQRVQEQQVEPELAPEEDDDLIATVLQEVIANEVRSQVTNALATMLHMMEKTVEQFFLSATLGARGGILIVVYDAVEQITIDQIRDVSVWRDG